MTVSVVIPVRDGERFVGAAIESALGQTVPPDEVIVIDDGSSDRSAAIARGYGDPVVVFEGEPHGIGGARNRGAARAAGEFLAFLDADDVWPADRTERLLVRFATAPRPEIVFGKERQFRDDEPDALAPPTRGLLATSMMIDRAAWTRLGGFDEGWEVGEFLDWLLRAREAGLREARIDDTVLHRRIHDANTTAMQSDAMGIYAHVLKASLDRRRGRS